MKLDDRVYLVASGDMGFNITNVFDCNVFLLDGGSELALIDTGAGIAPREIVHVMQADGFDPKKVNKILLTHAHADHAGGAHALAHLCDAEVFGLPDTARFVSTLDLDAISLEPAKKAGVYPDDYVFHGHEVVPIHDHDTVTVGDLELRVIETPGHSDGHASFLLNFSSSITLFAGDLVFHGGQVSLQSTWDCRIDKYAESLRRVAELPINKLFAGHLNFLLNRADVHIQTALRSLNKLALPRNIILP